jgi:thiol-disulfide isomerase/thioredoxin
MTLLSLVIILVSCTERKDNAKTLPPGDWVFELQLDENIPDLILPFNVEVIDSSELVFKNATERIRVNEVRYSGDSVTIVMPVFGSEFKALMTEESLSGKWFKYTSGKSYSIPFIARYGSTQRFVSDNPPEADFSGRWKSYFINQADTSEAIGVFAQSGEKVTGTFLTETGDFRYLDGAVDGTRLSLSAFDGAHAFLFEAVVDEKGKLNGTFRSGNHWEAQWLAAKDADAELRDMKDLTYLKEGYETFDFRFPDENGDTVSLTDPQFEDKLVVVQIFGTWCPNCMDETRFLVDMHKKYNAKGLEIIGLDFEPNPTLPYFQKRIARFRKDLDVSYTLLLAGSSNKKKATEALPMLNQIISFPTAIFLDKDKNIREIHTGFSGPGTGSEYSDYTNDTEALILELLGQK